MVHCILRPAVVVAILGHKGGTSNRRIHTLIDKRARRAGHHVAGWISFRREDTGLGDNTESELTTSRGLFT